MITEIINYKKDLTNAELLAKVKEAAKLQRVADEKQNNLNEYKKAEQADINKLELDAKHLIEQIDRGHVYLQVNCRVVKDYEAGLVYYNDISTGQVLQSKEMSPEDRQVEIGEQEAEINSIEEETAEQAELLIYDNDGNGYDVKGLECIKPVSIINKTLMCKLIFNDGDIFNGAINIGNLDSIAHVMVVLDKLRDRVTYPVINITSSTGEVEQVECALVDEIKGNKITVIGLDELIEVNSMTLTYLDWYNTIESLYSALDKLQTGQTIETIKEFDKFTEKKENKNLTDMLVEAGLGMVQVETLLNAGFDTVQKIIEGIQAGEIKSTKGIGKLTYEKIVKFAKGIN